MAGRAAIYRETGDRHGEGDGAEQSRPGPPGGRRRFDEAITAFQDAAASFRETGDRATGHDIDDLGATLLEMRRFEEAITAERGRRAMLRADRRPARRGHAR